MNMDDYQRKALSTAIDEGVELMHRTLGLVGEAGELAVHVGAQPGRGRRERLGLDRQILLEDDDRTMLLRSLGAGNTDE